MYASFEKIVNRISMLITKFNYLITLQEIAIFFSVIVLSWMYLTIKSQEYFKMTINITSWKFVLNSILDLVFQIKRTFVTRVWSFRCQSFADADIIASASKRFDLSANTPATIVVVRFIMSAFTAILKKATNKNTWVLYNNPPFFKTY